ncbi:hypothetical protein [Mobilicoccus massiliensis]|uniref:hypothetical protein n=1 Tax=Mobilicoccus massiliensis TaxID=1522310 RepID=UPI000693EB66|nr:hypothetical protein [Mobilicoccus massiliensis]
MTSTYCWDATLLIHAERAERLDSLGTYLPAVRHVVCDVVVAELCGTPLPEWLEKVAMDDVDTLRAFVRWQGVVGTSGGKNAGEAAVLAWSEMHDAVAIIDDRSARFAARTRGARVHGSLWALAQGINAGRSPAHVTGNFCDALLDTGIRWPFVRGGFPDWADEQPGLLTPDDRGS